MALLFSQNHPIPLRPLSPTTTTIYKDKELLFDDEELGAYDKRMTMPSLPPPSRAPREKGKKKMIQHQQRKEKGGKSTQLNWMVKRREKKKSMEKKKRKKKSKGARRTKTGIAGRRRLSIRWFRFAACTKLVCQGCQSNSQT